MPTVPPTPWRATYCSSAVAGTPPSTCSVRPAESSATTANSVRSTAAIPAATPVLLTCSDSDGQANCADVTPLADALEHTSLSLVALKGVNHVLRDDPSDNVGNYSKPGPLSPQLTAALNAFINS